MHLVHTKAHEGHGTGVSTLLRQVEQNSSEAERATVDA